MPLVDMKDMLSHAYEQGYAVAAFEVFNLDVLAGVISAAERDQAPVILSQKNQSDIRLPAPALERAAEESSAPVAIDSHCDSVSSGINAIKQGCNGLSLDNNQLSAAENIRLSREIINMAHACGVPVCASADVCLNCNEPGLPMSNLSLAHTDVLINNTSPDFIAINIDTKLSTDTVGMKFSPEQVRQIKQLVCRPLVLQNGMGLAREHYRGIMQNGVARINFGYTLSYAADECVQQNLERGAINYQDTVKGIAESVMKAAQRCIRHCGSAQKASELLEVCTPWAPVEHLIIYNTTDTSEQQVQDMMQEGKRVLAAIPGVRRVFTGHAIQENAAYRYSWLVRFCHPAVIDSYREHPDHVAFANKLFRPIAGDRISIDYQQREETCSEQSDMENAF